MRVKSIKNGNSFDVIYNLSLTVNGNTEDVDFGAVDNLKVYFQADTLPVQVIPDYFTAGNVLTASVREALPRSNAYYRMVLSFDYDGNRFMRNPVAFRVVDNVEQEDEGYEGCGCDNSPLEIRQVEVTETIGYERGRFGSIINVVDELPDAGVPGEFYAIPE
jgi:hypothetical protein